MVYPVSANVGTVAHLANVAKPWKANGAEVNPNATLEQWGEQAGLNYTVEPIDSQYLFNGILKTVPNRVQLVRSDTGESLSEMSKNTYKIRQPAEILEFFRNLTDANGMKMSIVGQMQGGKKIFALATREDGFAEIGKGSGDMLRQNVFLIESFDGSHATKARSQAERLFCLNQIETNYRSGTGYANKDAVKRKHSQEFDIASVQMELGAMDKSFAKYVEHANAMTGIKMTPGMVERFMTRLYAPDAFKDEGAIKNWKRSKYSLEDVSAQARNTVADVLNAVDDQLGGALPTMQGTLYGALNAVTFFHDHAARSKGAKRWESAMIGQGNTRKNEALELALEIVRG